MSKIYSFDQFTDSVELLERKPPRFIAVLLSLLFLSLIGFMIWAYVGKFDVVSKGTAIIQGKTDISVSKTEIAGIVDNVKVKSGDEVKKGDILIQLKNQELTNRQNQVNQIVKYLEEKRGMLEQLKKSIQVHQFSFSNGVDTKIKEEYKTYEQGYQSLQNEKENEIEVIENSKLSNEQDQILQGLIMEKDNVQREIESIDKQKKRGKLLEEQKQLLDDKEWSLDSQKMVLKSKLNREKKV